MTKQEDDSNKNDQSAADCLPRKTETKDGRKNDSNETKLASEGETVFSSMGDDEILLSATTPPCAWKSSNMYDSPLCKEDVELSEGIETIQPAAIVTPTSAMELKRFQDSASGKETASVDKCASVLPHILTTRPNLKKGGDEDVNVEVVEDFFRPGDAERPCCQREKSSADPNPAQDRMNVTDEIVKPVTIRGESARDRKNKRRVKGAKLGRINNVTSKTSYRNHNNAYVDHNAAALATSLENQNQENQCATLEQCLDFRTQVLREDNVAQLAKSQERPYSSSDEDDSLSSEQRPGAVHIPGLWGRTSPDEDSEPASEELEEVDIPPPEPPTIVHAVLVIPDGDEKALPAEIYDAVEVSLCDKKSICFVVVLMVVVAAVTSTITLVAAGLLGAGLHTSAAQPSEPVQSSPPSNNFSSPAQPSVPAQASEPVPTAVFVIPFIGFLVFLISIIIFFKRRKYQIRKESRR